MPGKRANFKIIKAAAEKALSEMQSSATVFSSPYMKHQTSYHDQIGGSTYKDARAMIGSKSVKSTDVSLSAMSAKPAEYQHVSSGLSAKSPTTCGEVLIKNLTLLKPSWKGGWERYPYETLTFEVPKSATGFVAKQMKDAIGHIIKYQRSRSNVQVHDTRSATCEALKRHMESLAVMGPGSQLLYELEFLARAIKKFQNAQDSSGKLVFGPRIMGEGEHTLTMQKTLDKVYESVAAAQKKVFADLLAPDLKSAFSNIFTFGELFALQHLEYMIKMVSDIAWPDGGVDLKDIALAQDAYKGIENTSIGRLLRVFAKTTTALKLSGARLTAGDKPSDLGASFSPFGKITVLDSDVKLDADVDQIKRLSGKLAGLPVRLKKSIAVTSDEAVDGMVVTTEVNVLECIDKYFLIIHEFLNVLVDFQKSSPFYGRVGEILARTDESFKKNIAAKLEQLLTLRNVISVISNELTLAVDAARSIKPKPKSTSQWMRNIRQAGELKLYMQHFDALLLPHINYLVNIVNEGASDRFKNETKQMARDSFARSAKMDRRLGISKLQESDKQALQSLAFNLFVGMLASRAATYAALITANYPANISGEMPIALHNLFAKYAQSSGAKIDCGKMIAALSSRKDNVTFIDLVLLLIVKTISGKVDKSLAKQIKGYVEKGQIGDSMDAYFLTAQDYYIHFVASRFGFLPPEAQLDLRGSVGSSRGKLYHRQKIADKRLGAKRRIANRKPISGDKQLVNECELLLDCMDFLNGVFTLTHTAAERSPFYNQETTQATFDGCCSKANPTSSSRKKYPVQYAKDVSALVEITRRESGIDDADAAVDRSFSHTKSSTLDSTSSRPSSIGPDDEVDSTLPGVVIAIQAITFVPNTRGKSSDGTSLKR